MEAQEHLMASNDDLAHNNIILKGKRTKRQRSSSPAPSKAAMITSSSSSTCGGGGVFVEDYGSISSPTTSSNYEEEVDMANCLILLAQGEGPRPTGNNPRTENSTAGKFSDLPMTTAASTGPGFYVYECKTCNRSFPSFQALGGHRASHKKPKVTAEEVKKITPPISDDVGGDCQLNHSSHDDRYLPISIHIAAVTSVATGKKGVQGNHKGKIHGCTICGSKFMSGQALGGHMRRHRPNNNNNNNTENETVIIVGGFDNCESVINGEIKGSRSELSLDLNLPAPEDDHLHHESGPEFQFGSTKQALMFSAPALVDCHY